MLTFDQLRETNTRRCRESFHPVADWNVAEWGCAMAGEAGEAANLAKKMRRGDHITADQIGEELADVIIYADLMAAYLGVDLETAVREKFNKTSGRVGSPHKL
jgi:NTP pyrophosphatase (non-canonical NTP hydrolase)